MTTTEQLRAELRRLAADLVDAPAETTETNGTTGTADHDLRLTAALLTGWGDLAQDALHVALCRVRLAHPDRPPEAGEVLVELTRLAREPHREVD